MFELKDMTTGRVVSRWPTRPAKITIPGTLTRIHSPSLGAVTGRYELVETVQNVDAVPLMPDAPNGERWELVAGQWIDARTDDERLIYAKATKMEALAGMLSQEQETRAIEVPYSGGIFRIGVDKSTRENLQMAILGALISPVGRRQWTPKGSIEPVDLSRDDITSIGLAVGAEHERLVRVYLSHKAAIAILTDAASVDAYDIGSGWNIQ